MNEIDRIIAGVIARESDQYTDRPADSGGPTKFGITQRALSAWRKQYASSKDVRDLTRAEAEAIYHAKYISDPGFAPIIGFSMPLAVELIDTGVNCGPGRAIEFLQRLLNALNAHGRHWPDLAVDMDCGPATLSALRAFYNKRGRADAEKVLLRGLNGLQVAHYLTLAEKRPKDEEFFFGWLKERVS